MARWYGFRLDEIRAMSLADFHMLDGFTKRFPPTEILMKAELTAKGFRFESEAKQQPVGREVLKMNSEVLAQLPPRRNVKTLAQMPAFLRTPEQLKMYADMKAKWQTS